MVFKMNKDLRNVLITAISMASGVFAAGAAQAQSANANENNNNIAVAVEVSPSQQVAVAVAQEQAQQQSQTQAQAMEMSNSGNSNVNGSGNSKVNSVIKNKTPRSYSFVAASPVSVAGRNDLVCVAMPDTEIVGKGKNKKTYPVLRWQITAALVNASATAGGSIGPASVALPLGTGGATVKYVKIPGTNEQQDAIKAAWCGGQPARTEGKVEDKTPNFTPAPVAPASITYNDYSQVTINEAAALKPTKVTVKQSYKPAKKPAAKPKSCPVQIQEAVSAALLKAQAEAPKCPTPAPQRPAAATPTPKGAAPAAK